MWLLNAEAVDCAPELNHLGWESQSQASLRLSDGFATGSRMKFATNAPVLQL